VTDDSKPKTVPEAIEIRDLQHHYKKVLALENISLSLPGGSTIGLIGPDGVGKSTLLGLIAGVKRIQQGSVTVLGTNLNDPARREEFLPRIAFMPQGLGRNLYPTLSVYENIDFFGRLFGQDAKERTGRITRLLQATTLTDFIDRPAGKLSGGMKQKLALCCALVHDPDLLILDEPTTGVDPLSRRQFWKLVDDLRTENGHMTVIVATAYMEEAERFEHLVAMDAGHILVSDTTRNVLARTKTDKLEAAYIALLPSERRAEATGFTIPPYHDPGGVPTIEAEGLTRRFGSFVAVDNVSFRIGTGEIFGFLGSNGCGKTTTMKMLTGLLDITAGSAKLLGKQVDAHDMLARMRIGYMSQSFSLYEELTVRQNLMLHARLYRVAQEKAGPLVDTALTDFALKDHADTMPVELPLGIRQRLQLAAACLHSPEVLILDEPTSGVDPAARDMFWKHLIQLSREKHVTIFISTHFMNEAERCDRISLMHHGRVLAVGTPAELMSQKKAATLEDAFIAFLEEAEPPPAQAPSPPPVSQNPAVPSPVWGSVELSGKVGGWLAHMWAFARRETMELARDKMRLAFALLGPMVILCIAAYSISFDIGTIRYAVLDHDRTQASREFLQHFSGSHWFVEAARPHSRLDAEQDLRSGAALLVIDIPPSFGSDLESSRQPEVGLSIEGAEPFTAANIRAYTTGIVLEYAAAVALAQSGASSSLPIAIAPRFVYNQEFRSIYALTPGVIMLVMILIPSMLTALGIVREKEIGSIINLYASPASIGQYLIGKQIPYVGLAMLSYLSIVLLTVLVLGVPLKGSFLALSLGMLLFIVAATSLGLLISAFVSSQVAAIFGSSIICMILGVNFSGLLYPVSTLTGSGYWIGLGFPASWFQLISLGCFTKGLGMGSFATSYAALAGFGVLYLLGARLLLGKQEA
jgi:ribosome-dependent ATPase